MIEERLTRVVPVEVLTVGEVLEDFLVDSEPSHRSLGPFVSRVQSRLFETTKPSYPIALTD